MLSLPSSAASIFCCRLRSQIPVRLLGAMTSASEAGAGGADGVVDGVGDGDVLLNLVVDGVVDGVADGAVVPTLLVDVVGTGGVVVSTGEASSAGQP